MDNTDFINHTNAKYKYLASRYALLFLENKHNAKFLEACDSLHIDEDVRFKIETMTFDMDLATTNKIDAITGCKFWSIASPKRVERKDKVYF